MSDDSSNTISDVSGSDSIWDDPDEPVATEQSAATEQQDTSAELANDEQVEDSSVTEVAKPGASTSTATPAPIQASKKTILFKAGDQDVSLDENATFTWKVDGKEQPIAVKDLVQNWAGKIPWERKYQELANERKKAASEATQFEQTRERHSKLITDMHKSAAEGKVFEAVQAMIEMTGLDKKVDAREYVRNLRTSLMEQAKKLATMNEHERALYEANEERDYLKSRNERLTQQREREETQRVFQERVAKVVQDAGTTLEEFVQTRDWLSQQLKGMGRDVAQVTPEFVASHIRDVRDYRSAKDALTSVDPKLAENQKLWDHTVYLIRTNPDWTQDDLKDVLRKSVEYKRSTSVGRTIAKAPVATVATASAKAKTQPAKQKAQSGPFGDFSAEDLDW